MPTLLQFPASLFEELFLACSFLPRVFFLFFVSLTPFESAKKKKGTMRQLKEGTYQTQNQDQGSQNNNVG